VQDRVMCVDGEVNSRRRLGAAERCNLCELMRACTHTLSHTNTRALALVKGRGARTGGGGGWSCGACGQRVRTMPTCRIEEGG